MKKIILLLALPALIFAGCVITACNKTKVCESRSTGFYVIGYDCGSSLDIGKKYGKAGGYIIVSADLQDTLLTYNLPDNRFNFPSNFFSTNCCFTTFPDEYRYCYNFNMDYRMALPEEEIYNIYPQHLICVGFKDIPQIIILATFELK